MAFALKKSVSEILALPMWERVAWRAVFELYGPLDWTRTDYHVARINQFQSVGESPLKDFLLFTDPKDWKTREEREKEALANLGWKE